MIEKYTKIYLKRNIILALICATIVFIPLLIVSLIYDVLSYDLIVAFTPFPIAFICVLISFLPIIRFRKMIMQQESLYDTVFSDTDADHLETTLYLSKNWLIWAGSCAIYKNHIQSIQHKLETGRVGSSNKVTITTVDNKRYIIWCLSTKNIKKIKISSLRKHFGQMLQDVFLFSGDIRSNILLREEGISDEEVMEACRYVNADSFINRMEHGLDEVVQERGNNFSAGQRQLLSFARTIIHKPSVMILDEATANIDTETELLIQDSLEKMKNIGTMLIVAHRLSTIQHADNIILLSHGEIMEQGNHQELLAQKGRYYHLYTLQYSKQQLEGSVTL